MNIETVIENSLPYSSYRKLVSELILRGKTTGSMQTEKLLEFTKLNVQRMSRLDKTIQLSEQILQRVKNSSPLFRWLLIGDAWCGDCAQIIPVINKIAEASNDKIKFSIISRDYCPELIELYQTNGAEAIPKLLVIHIQSNEVVCAWGPRPKPAQEIMLNWKKNKSKIAWNDFEKDLHLWYSRDKGETIINELINLIELCERKIILQP